MKSGSKISVIGSGNIGSTIALLSSANKLAETYVLYDIIAGMPQGKALDLQQSLGMNGMDAKFIGTNNYEEIRDSDVIFVTAGISRKPGMSRDDLLATNKKIITEIASNVKKYSKDAFCIIITNPLDIVVEIFQQVSQLPASKVVGMAGVLDSARFRKLLAEKLCISVHDIQATTLGGHGDLMVLLPRFSSVAGVPLFEFIEMGLLKKEELDDICEKTRNGGAEIVSLLKTSSAYYAPAKSALEMAESYLYDRKRLLQCSAYLNGEYNHSHTYAGVPCIIGKNGVEKIIELRLNKEEKAQLDACILSLKRAKEGTDK